MPTEEEKESGGGGGELSLKAELLSIQNNGSDITHNVVSISATQHAQRCIS